MDCGPELSGREIHPARQRTAGSPAADSRQRTTDSGQQATDSRQRTIDGRRLAARGLVCLYAEIEKAFRQMHSGDQQVVVFCVVDHTYASFD